MDSEELAALHQHNQYSRDAIKDCVHDLACRCHGDRTHSRIEAQLQQLSRQVTEQARREAGRPDQPSA
jgi:hypothetical protein